MNKVSVVAIILAAGSFSSCVTKKKYRELESRNKNIMSDMGAASAKLIECDREKIEALARLRAMEEQNAYLKKNSDDLINNVGNLTTLTSKGAANLEKSLESIKEKDVRITRLQDALTRKDSVTLAIVTSLKSSLGNVNDQDIEINVEKGVVFVSIADKLLFQSGSYTVQDAAKTVLGKVATVVKAKPDFEIMVEGHTDNVPVSKGSLLLDNWDLSVKRATAIVRVLQNEFAIEPGRIVAAGRGEFVPLTSNDSPDGRARNRRTRIIVLPKLDQFYKMVEEGMKQAPK
ncbi:MAG: flagellar motor protein MotB [Opitutaceae bacterium]|nr:flagellar motor protein MotB [Cytophagales bacterium]